MIRNRWFPPLLRSSLQKPLETRRRDDYSCLPAFRTFHELSLSTCRESRARSYRAEATASFDLEEQRVKEDFEAEMEVPFPPFD